MESDMKKTIMTLDNPLNLLGINNDIAIKLDDALVDVASCIKQDINNTLKSAKKQMRNKIAMSYVQQLNIARTLIDFRMMNADTHQINIAANISAYEFTILQEKHPDIDSSELLELFYTEKNSKQIPLIHLPKSIKIGFSEQLCSVKYLIRRINSSIKQNRELVAIKIGLIGKFGTPAVSNAAIDDLKQSKRKSENFLKNKVIVNKQTGDYSSAPKLTQQKSQQYAENLCFLNGLNDYAIRNIFSAALITITLPSSFRLINTTNTIVSPLEANQYILKKWRRYKNKIDRWISPCFMFKVIEPHNDSFPHWHIMIFFPNHMKIKHQNSLLKAFDLNSFRSNQIDWSDLNLHKNYAIGYLAKKIKNDLGPANCINSSDKNVKRCAYLSTWGISGNEFLGLPRQTKGLWRELSSQEYTEILPEPLNEIRSKIKSRRFAEFFELFLEHKANISLIKDQTSFSKNKKTIGIRWNDQDFLSKKSEFKVMSEDKANQLKLKITGEIILNKPRSSEPIVNPELKKEPDKILQEKNTEFNEDNPIALKNQFSGYVFINSIFKFLANKMRAFKILCQV